MAQSIKLADDLMDEARIASEIHSRSLSGQIAHWARIGKAIERSNAFSHDRIDAVLSGKAPYHHSLRRRIGGLVRQFREVDDQPDP